MDILILGGTRFVGKWLARTAVERGHKVWLFHRTQPREPTIGDVIHLLGDRSVEAFSSLICGVWDVVFDSSGYLPNEVAASARFLRTRVEQYIFVSSANVYQCVKGWRLHEDIDLDEPALSPPYQRNKEQYGELKLLCERAVEDAFPGQNVILRPTYIVGPEDHSGRLAYWIQRVRSGNQVLAPAPRKVPLQLIDCRDFANFAIALAEQRATGIFNVAGSETALNFESLLQNCADGGPLNAEWVSAEFLLANGVRPGIDLPFWEPGNTNGAHGQYIEAMRAQRKGLSLRNISQTIKDCRSDALTAGYTCGLSARFEKQLLEAWKARQLTSVDVPESSS